MGGSPIAFWSLVTNNINAAPHLEWSSAAPNCKDAQLRFGARQQQAGVSSLIQYVRVT